MRFMTRQRVGASAAAFAVGLALHGIAAAQGNPPAAGTEAGMVTGQVDRCINGAELPAPQVVVGIEGGGALARTDSNGEFILALPPGQYNVVATASDGTASRLYIPVAGGQALDIGILDIGGGVAGCGPDADITAPVLPTLAPTVVATPEPTVVPTLVPTAIPTPAPDAPADAPADPAPAE